MKAQAKVERREGLARLMTRSDHLKLAQIAFNAFIRARDAGKVCISCARDHKGQWHAGHYRTVKAAPELRFDEDNCHRQCAPCNDHLSGNIVEYRIGLLSRIGPERLARLEGPHPPTKLSVDEIKALAEKYRRLAREIAKPRLDNAA
jgi:hypothetical protein